ncbi:MAG: hypothetical protein EP343_03165 [Deltaproteobacteria bacterium]|nr:MAG: hypothetical protein EP343_03165 [Deltaproteobacteria bacterium]
MNRNALIPPVAVSLWGEDLSLLTPWVTTVLGAALFVTGGWLAQVSPSPEASAPMKVRDVVSPSTSSKAKPSAPNTLAQGKPESHAAENKETAPAVRADVTSPAPVSPNPRLVVLASHTTKQAQPKDCPPLFVLFFGKNKKQPFPIRRSKWRSLKAWFKKHNDTTLVLRGYADGKGAKAYNLLLSYHRAQTVQALLLKEGFPSQRIRLEARGNLDNQRARNVRGNQRRVVLNVPGYESCERQRREEQL